jgi:transcription termination factor Rho
VTSRADLQKKPIADLRQIAQAIGVESDGLQKAKLISAILDHPDTEVIETAPEVELPEVKKSSNGAAPEGEAAGDAPDGDSGAEEKDGDDVSGDGESRDGGQRSEGGQNQQHRDGQNQQGQQGDGRRRRRKRGGGGAGDRPRWEDMPDDELEFREGLLDVLPEGYGFLRTSGYKPGDKDVYVSVNVIRRNGLRRGDLVVGPIRPARNQEKFPALIRVQSVNGMDVETARNRPKFEKLTPLFPDQRLRLEVVDARKRVLPRIVDLIAPIGKGQRGLIVSPPKAGKTTVLKEIATSIAANNPECHLMVVLVDERPEEVTDMQRTVKGDVVYSTFDRPAEEHTQVAELAIERAKRMVEMGTDVVILLDSITRLARAHNLATPASGRILSGGVDSQALYPPKRFFGAARNIEEGGSLTILGTALVETGSKMDEVIFEEFKGTGNMELKLDRRLADKRIYPAIDVEASGTRREELLFTPDELAQVWKLRRVLLALEPGPALELLIDRLKSSPSNAQFLAEVAKNT